MRVEIDGVLYAPVTEAVPSARLIEDALIRQWWGSVPEDREAVLRELRVIVTDGDDDRETVAEFVARIANGLGGAVDHP